LKVRFYERVGEVVRREGKGREGRGGGEVERVE
jgi:hypothetical protein